MKPNKYTLYQVAVQDPKSDAELYSTMYSDLHGKEPLVLREDFCAGFAFSCAWVQRSPKHRALCLDLDSVPLQYGKENNLSKLTPDQQKRVHVLKKNVMTVTRPQADLIVAGNFSFFFLKRRQDVLRYFESARRSLKKGGLLFLELAGGPEFLEKGSESRTVRSPKTGKFIYTWEQKSFDPITRDAHYAIHFKFPDGSMKKDAFTYDWRLWTVPEVREAMSDAGFRKTHVYWEKIKRGKETGFYERAEHSDNRVFWLGYVVGEA
jgi:hypothetical protein